MVGCSIGEHKESSKECRVSLERYNRRVAFLDLEAAIEQSIEEVAHGAKDDFVRLKCMAAAVNRKVAVSSCCKQPGASCQY